MAARPGSTRRGKAVSRAAYGSRAACSTATRPTTTAISPSMRATGRSRKCGSTPTASAPLPAFATGLRLGRGEDGLMAKQADVSDPGRRAFLGAAAVGTGAMLAGVAAPGVARAAETGPAPQVDFPPAPAAFGGGPAGTNNRAEIDRYDCEVEGAWPADLDGAFYR